ALVDAGAGLSGILVPHAIDGRPTFVLGAYRLAPRRWRNDEIETLRDLAGRVYVRLERVRADEAHRTNEARYRTLFESIDEGFCVIEMLFDGDGVPIDYRFLEVNPAFERQSGLHAAEGKRMRELVPAHEAHWFEIYGRVATSGEPASFVERATALGGRWFDVDAVRLGDPASRNVAVIFTDITKRKRADDALRESEARLRRAIEIETVGVIFFRVDGAITYANDAFLRMSGYRAADVANGEVRWDTMTPPEWMPRTREAVDEFVTIGRMSPYEKEYIRKDGSRWWSLCAATRLDDHEGIKFIVDITSSKVATAEQARLAAMVDSSRDAFIGTDVNGIITSWNPAAMKLYGYTAEEAVGRNVSILMPPDSAHERDGMLDQVRRGEDPSPLETQQRRKDGSWVDVELRPSRILDTAGHFAGVAVVASDATERRRLERAQDDFLAMASHDLRSPVTVVRGRAQMMQRRRAYDEGGINVILDQTRRIERLTDDLQELVRLEAGKIEIARTTIDLGELATEAADRLRIQHDARRMRVVTSGAPVIGQWDRDRIGQILDNLLENAAKYTDEASEIVVTVTGTESEARVSITDRGPGISADAASRLFERFYRVDESGATAGLGLGLYIARMLAEAQGGRIWVESELGTGSTFTVALPLAP
ncbi:MAG: PAS domain S-box protein, partial [Chloroflexota bacterium]|nr:PAS domain S-box protein [Chloroflexota bacterium]